MKITPVDSQKNLFVVENYYPAELLAEFLNTDHLLSPYTKENMQNKWPRRKLILEPESIYERVDVYNKYQTHVIGSIIGVDIVASDTGFWLDEPGFYMGPHLDNDGVQISMQIYLNDNIKELGTVFYNTDNTIRHRLEYTVNTGYIMINGPEQYHAMMTPVPKDSYRISSYSWLHPKA